MTFFCAFKTNGLVKLETMKSVFRLKRAIRLFLRNLRLYYALELPIRLHAMELLLRARPFIIETTDIKVASLV